LKKNKKRGKLAAELLFASRKKEKREKVKLSISCFFFAGAFAQAHQKKTMKITLYKTKKHGKCNQALILFLIRKCFMPLNEI